MLNRGLPDLSGINNAKPKDIRINSKETRDEARRRDNWTCMYHLYKYHAIVAGTDIHHIYTRGSGGDDVLPNLISLCRECHNNAHLGKISKLDLQGILLKYYGQGNETK